MADILESQQSYEHWPHQTMRDKNQIEKQSYPWINVAGL